MFCQLWFRDAKNSGIDWPMRAFRGKKTSSWRTRAPSEAVWLHTGIVSHFGTTWFREAPRFTEEEGGPESDVSMMRGEVTANEIYRMMTGRPPRPGGNVRRFDVAALWNAGYWVCTSRDLHNPDHVRVVAPFEDPAGPDAQAWWARPERVRLEELALEERGDGS